MSALLAVLPIALSLLQTYIVAVHALLGSEGFKTRPLRSIPREEWLTEDNFLRISDWEFGAELPRLKRLGVEAPPELSVNTSSEALLHIANAVGRVRSVLIWVGPGRRCAPEAVERGLQKSLTAVARLLKKSWPRGVRYAIIPRAYDALPAGMQEWLPWFEKDARCTGIWIANIMSSANPSKLMARPLGLPDHFESGSADLPDSVPSFDDLQQGGKMKPLIAGHSVFTQFGEREAVRGLCIFWDFCSWHAQSQRRLMDVAAAKLPDQSELPRITTNFYEDLIEHKFVLAPSGAMFGSDSGTQQTFRLWEAFYLGVVPIILAGDLEKLLRGLPALHLKRWGQLTEEYLKKAEEKLRYPQASCQPPQLYYHAGNGGEVLRPLNSSAMNNKRRFANRLKKLTEQEGRVAEANWHRKPSGACTLWISWWAAKIRRQLPPELTSDLKSAVDTSLCRARFDLRFRRLSGAMVPSDDVIRDFSHCRQYSDAAFVVMDTFELHPVTSQTYIRGFCLPAECAKNEASSLALIQITLKRNLSSTAYTPIPQRASCWMQGMGPELCCRRSSKHATLCFGGNELIRRCCDAASLLFMSELAGNCCKEPWAPGEPESQWRLPALSASAEPWSGNLWELPSEDEDE
eukprot:TRINITY_DN50389_c0_g1_i1.p1 TRINITY_DN50389_c0_g1~~TRINITY_DN50389_c0_g1_i1.p1  ORF type:complete len:632 (-),score=106.59 TRINITY_DN50389_c0_g1_i1:62-1957(-)